jgi:copper(I)-binding protein
MSDHFARPLSRRLILGAALVAGVLIAGRASPLHAADASVIARDAWVRVPAPSKDETVLYVVLENHSAERRAVVAASSDLADRVEMHEMRMNGRLMTMDQVDRITVPAKGRTELRSGGLHIMLFGLKKRPAVGDTVAFVLTLDDGTKVPVAAAVRK